MIIVANNEKLNEFQINKYISRYQQTGFLREKTFAFKQGDVYRISRGTINLYLCQQLNIPYLTVYVQNKPLTK